MDNVSFFTKIKPQQQVNDCSVSEEIFNLVLLRAEYRAKEVLVGNFAVFQLFRCSAELQQSRQLPLESSK